MNETYGEKIDNFFNGSSLYIKVGAYFRDKHISKDEANAIIEGLPSLGCCYVYVDKNDNSGYAKYEKLHKKINQTQDERCLRVLVIDFLCRSLLQRKK